MRAGIKQKWRPSLALVVGGTVGGVLGAGIAGLLLLGVLPQRIGLDNALIVVAVLVVTLTLLLGYLLWRLLLRPVTALAARARALQAGAPAGPLPHYGTQELQALGQAVLDMAATLQNRQDSIRAYTDHVTHELKSPLTSLIGAAELLDGQDDLAPAERTKLLATIRSSAGRIEDLLAAMRAMAAARTPLGPATARLSDVLPALEQAHPGLDLRIRGEAAVLPIPAEGLEAVLRQLLGNAAAHGAQSVQLDAAEAPPVLHVRDDGQGVSPGNRDRIFDPFFTTRRAAGGTGMGLAIVRNLLAARGAEIALEDGGAGAGFSIRF